MCSRVVPLYVHVTCVLELFLSRCVLELFLYVHVTCVLELFLSRCVLHVF